MFFLNPVTSKFADVGLKEFEGHFENNKVRGFGWKYVILIVWENGNPELYRHFFDGNLFVQFYVQVHALTGYMRPVYAVMEIVRLLDNLCVLS